MAQSNTVTLLFTDIVNSTVHLTSAGDEAGEHVFRAHHKLMSDAIKVSGGEELQWLGDGLLAAFGSAADAVRCAIAMQQATSRPLAGVRMEIRIGIHAGEVLRREGGYFGTALVIARRLCDRGDAGQILCSSLITALLTSRQTFSFRELGDFDLKGISTPVAVCEVAYLRHDPAALLKRMPFVGRTDQLDRLTTKLEDAIKGRGSVAMLVGEAGIGKTRTIEEFVDQAHHRGAQVLRGNCYAGEWHAPYCPFAEILMAFASREGAEQLRAMVGAGTAASLLRIAPGLGGLLETTAEARGLDVDEERHRMLDAVGRFLVAASARAPLVLVLDDLHWADTGTAAMIGHLARLTASHQILLLGAYRDSEIDRRHPLEPVLASLRRLPDFASIGLQGLSTGNIQEMLDTIGAEVAPEPLVQAVGSETSGNPFFIREVLLYLRENGKILSEGGSWLSKFSVEELQIPEGIKELVAQRMGRLSNEANQMLVAASAFKGACVFSVAATVAGLDEATALNALDEAINAQVLRPTADPENFEFTHAIIRHTLYLSLNPRRRVRLHRKIAEAMEGTWGERAAEHAADVAYHFWRADTAGGTARGVEYAIAAADNAEAAYAYDEVVAFLRIALELLPESDQRRTPVAARLGTALIWSAERDQAAKVVIEAGERIATAEGNVAAVDYLEGATSAMFSAGLRREPWEIAKVALAMIGDRRDVVWASLRDLDLMREEAEDATNPGIRTDTPGQRELRTLLRAIPPEQIATRDLPPSYHNRDEVMHDRSATPVALLFLAADCRGSLPLWRSDAAKAEQQGRAARAARRWANVMTCHVALGEFTEARAACDRALALTARAVGLGSRFINMDLMGARHDLRIALDEGWQNAFEDGTSELFFEPKPEQNWAFAMTCSNGAYLGARTNLPDTAIQLLGMLPRALERGAPWEASYSPVSCDAAAVLWYTGRTDFIEVIESSIREKVLASDFRWPMRDARLALGRLCALRNQYEEAAVWFERARQILDEAGARPLRAIVDYDEAVMFIRREDAKARARELLHAATQQFRTLSMNGWIARAEETMARL
jgi:class 3 adenylate cyclase/tetratricopeptide (TPR) repeat protein